MTFQTPNTNHDGVFDWSVLTSSSPRLVVTTNCKYVQTDGNDITYIEWLNELSRWIKQLIQAYHQYSVGTRPALLITKRCTRLAAASDKVYQLLAHGRWFSPGTPASSTTKTGRHDIAEILLKVALKHQKSKSKHNIHTYHNSISRCLIAIMTGCFTKQFVIAVLTFQSPLMLAVMINYKDVQSDEKQHSLHNYNLNIMSYDFR